MNKLRKPPSGFTMVPNALIRSDTLSLKAKGLYCLLFSKRLWSRKALMAVSLTAPVSWSLSGPVGSAKSKSVTTRACSATLTGTYPTTANPWTGNPSTENRLLIILMK